MRPHVVRRLRIAAVACLAVAGPACATLRPGGDGALDVLAAAARGAAAVDTVWPGYRPFARGFILFEPGRGAWLVTDHAPPEPWVAAASDEPGLAGRLYRRTTDLPGLTGGIDTDYPVGDRSYTAVESDDDVKATLVTLYHEAFHAWQDSAFAELLPEHLPASAVTPQQVAGILLERRILASALRAGDGPASDSLIAAFLSVRGERMAALPDSVRRVDRSLERKEGLAHLVGYQSAAAALGMDPGTVRAAIVSTLEADLADFGGDHVARHYRWRAYGTGAAMGLLLDRIGDAWRARTAGGVPLDSLLFAAARIGPSDALLAGARARFGHAELLASAEATAPAVSADPIGDFLALEPHRLVVEIVADSALALSMSFDPGDAGFSNPAPSVTLMRDVARASMTSSAVDLSVSGRSVMMDGRHAPVLRVVVLLPRGARIDGRDAAPLSGPLDGTLRITGEDTEVTVRGEQLLEIEVEPGIVTVRVRM